MRVDQFRTIFVVSGLFAWYAATCTPARAQTLTTLPGETSLQQAAGNAVLNMCAFFKTNYGLVGLSELSAAQQDLYGQCHSLKVASATATTAAGATPLLGALQQVSGNEVSTQGALTTRVVAGQFANISGRLNALRLGGLAAIGHGGVTASNDDSGADDTPDAVVALDPPPQQLGALLDTAFLPDRAQPLTQASDAGAGYANASAGSDASHGPESPWGWFTEGSYSSGHHDPTVNEDPYHFHVASVTVGLDYNFGNAVLGGSIGYDDYDADFRALGELVSGGSAQVQGTSGSLYGAWFGQNWTFNGIATYGRLSSDLSRVVSYTIPNPSGGPFCAPLPATTCAVNQTFKGSPDGKYNALGATAGYDVTAAGWNLTPSLSLSYRRADIDGFAETAGGSGPGAGLALAYNDQAVESLRTITAADLSRPFSRSFGIVTPILRVEWDHEFRNNPREIQARYAADPSPTCVSCFDIASDPAPSDYGIAGAGISVLLAHRWQAYAYFEDLFAAAHYSSDSIAIGIRGQF